MVADTLSQNEIDALLSAISQGNEAGIESEPVQNVAVPQAAPAQNVAVQVPINKKNKKVKLYDFRRPDKFAKEQLRTVNRIHEAFARAITTTLSTTLRAMVSVQVISVDQVMYEEFIRSVPNPTVISIFDVGGSLKGTSVFEMNLGVATAIIERLFGGGGTSSPSQGKRALTNIEEAVIKRIMSRMLDNLAEAWSQIVDIDPHIDIMESNPQFTAIVPPTEMVLLITFEIKVMDTEGVLNICFPHMVLEPVLEKLSAQFFYTSMGEDETNLNFENISQSLSKTKMPLVVELGRTKATVGEFLNMKVGDIVVLDKKVDDLLDVQVGSVKKFRAYPGLIDNKMAITVVQVLNENEGEEEKL